MGDNDSSDMVNKEMYTFKDKGQRDLSLRPEGTKGVIRSFVEIRCMVMSICRLNCII